LGLAYLAGLLTTEPASVRAPPIYVTTTVMADVEPVAKKSKQGPPVAATMLRVESSILGPASAGRRDPPESKPAAVSPPEIVRDVNVVSDPPSPQAEPPLELAIISDPGEDLDDELAMVFLRHMVKQDPSLIVRCVVCNLRPATKRAALIRLWYIVEVDLYITSYVLYFTVLGLVGGAPRGETPRVTDSPTAGAAAFFILVLA
jgi:hypothetical protein